MTRVPLDRDPRDPLAGVDLVLVDANNLLGAMARGTPGAANRQPPAALIARLRAAIPLPAKVEVVFDGPADRGTRGERIAQGLTVRYGGRFSADTILVTLVEEASAGDVAAADRVLVVSDDRELRTALRRRGARTASTTWLIRRLEPGGARGPAGTTSVGSRPGTRPRPGQPPTDGSDDAERPGWAPGRGATTKRGNPRRAPRQRREPGR